MRDLCIPVTIVFVVCGCSEMINTMSTSDSTQLLRWAPLHLKSPYLTFLNKYYNPSWRTRHPITKEEESLRYLRLPLGVPFAVVCGACFQRSHVTTNLTVSVSGHAYQSVPKMSNKRQAEYRVGYLECLMTYMITAPIERDGTLTCTLTRGTQKKTESISFDVVDVSIEEPPEELQIQNEKKTVTLQCPSPDETPSVGNPLVHVWHEDHSQLDAASPPMTEMTSIISLRRPKHTRQIICSVYNIGQPSKVYRARYQILGNYALAKQEYHVSNDLLNEEDVEESTPKIKLSKSVVGIIATAAVVCVLLIVMGIYRFVAAARR